MPVRAARTAGSTSAGVRRPASSTTRTGREPLTERAISAASRVFPAPPVATTVTSGASSSALPTAARSGSRPTSGVAARRQAAGRYPVRFGRATASCPRSRARCASASTGDGSAP
ncbi:hypothetical protein OHA72_52300 [Dactylosporangium sp. NBC_01737]|uniref:hypothetical protein n=1 Tax=Dactylosporangium sp. NBC_01737 TaxID=2975959 RepID=UPI002E10A7C6|nr:hypothetical protein OHA72_52300 [Dactylosporangium sp. NBC_01737]